MLKYNIRDVKYVDRDKFLQSLCNKKRVLHIGCTDAPHFKWAFQNDRMLHIKLAKVAKSIVGLDISKSGLAFLRELEPSLELIEGDICSLQKLTTFDGFEVVVFSDVIEHLASPGDALINISKIMDVHCSLVVTAPNVFGYKNFGRAILGNEIVHEDHVAYYSPYTLQNLLRRFDIEVVSEFSYSGGSPRGRAKIGNLIHKIVPWLADGIGAVGVVEQ